MENSPDDERDLEFQKAAIELTNEIHLRLQKLLWKDSPNNQVLHRFVRRKDLETIVLKIDVFQENSQLLDTHLSKIVTALSHAYIYSSLHYGGESESESKSKAESTRIPLSSAVAKILYMLCKVRGEKVILRLLNHEPKYLELLLSNLESLQFESSLDDSSLVQVWQERFVLLVWLSHLMLAPFDLATISSSVTTKEDDSQLKLPEQTPGIAKIVIPICLHFLSSPTKEKFGAGRLLVQLCVRPDIVLMGLLSTIVNFVNANVLKPSNSLHVSLGYLQFLSYLVSSASRQELGSTFKSIHLSCTTLQQDSKYKTLQSSAISQKLLIKIQTKLSIMFVQSNQDEDGSENINEDILTDHIDTLLQSLANNDSLVRMIASKSLSVITQQLEPEVAQDIIEAIFESFREDVVGTGITANYSAVNPLRWHGLSLTLSHLIYRRAVPLNQLHNVLTFLILSLNFEQRSATGSSVGTNVRDAANFGIWSISRRYRTEELVKIPIDSFRSTKAHKMATSIIQILAIELLRSASLDPAGNVRRGSSAALQELIGRHPNAVVQGIALTQTVDYHAVSLMRNSIKSAANACSLSEMYWWAIYEALFEWRGTESVDESTRNLLGDAIFYLTQQSCVLSFVDILIDVSKKIISAGKNLEVQHGLLQIAIGCLRSLSVDFDDETTFSTVKNIFEISSKIIPSDVTIFQARSSISRTLAFSCISFQYQLGCYINKCLSIISLGKLSLELGTFSSHLDICLKRLEGEEFDEFINKNVNLMEFIALLHNDFGKKVQDWIDEIDPKRSKMSPCGIVLALGASASFMESNTAIDILKILVLRCSKLVDVDSRVMAMKALQFASLGIENKYNSDSKYVNLLLESIQIGLTDFTISRRGDIGSQVRIAALKTLQVVQRQVNLSEDQKSNIAVLGIPLALEKLDRVREAAWKIQFANIDLKVWTFPPHQNSSISNQVVSKEFYFQWLQQLLSPIDASVKKAIVQGYISSAGGGSEAVVVASHEAFIQLLSSSASHSSLDIAAEFLKICQQILNEDVKNDRIVIPLLDTLALIGDMGLFGDLKDREDIKWKLFLSLVQKSHYQSANITKIHSAISVYRSLVQVDSIKPLVVNKLKSMLLHNYTKSRIVAAETLFLVTEQDGWKDSLKKEDWSKPKIDLKEVVSSLETANV